MPKIDYAPTLRQGEKGDWVTYLQHLLNIAHCPPGGFGGSFGAGTLKAVKRFQEHLAGLPATGVVDDATWAALYKWVEEKEADDTQDGQIVGADDADERKLAAGDEIGRRGWCRTNVQFRIHDFSGGLLHGQTYVRFIASDGSESDEGDYARHGSLSLPNIWVPAEGQIRMTMFVVQRLPTDVLSEVSGIGDFNRRDASLSFSVRQRASEPVTITRTQAAEWGLTSGMKAEGGVDFEIVTLGAEISYQESFSESTSESTTLTVKFPTEVLDIDQTG